MKRNFIAIALALFGWMLNAPAQDVSSTSQAEVNLATNPAFDNLDKQSAPAGYTLGGSAVYRSPVSDVRRDAVGAGVVFDGTAPGGSVSQTVVIDPKKGRSYAFRFRGLPQDGFAVGEDGLSMKVEFFGNGGRTAYDGKLKQLYPLIEKTRHDLATNGDMHVGGAAVWRDYVLSFYVPFPQVDRVKLTVAYTGGGPAPASTPMPTPPSPGIGGGGPGGFQRGPRPMFLVTGGHEFLITDFSLTALPEPAVAQPTTAPTQPAATLLPLGGRWFYAAKSGETAPPALFNSTNADRLLYRDGPNGQSELPFYGNMSATLRAGDKDLAGNVVTADRLIADNVTVRFDGTSMIIHSHGLPNHPTGRFPEEAFGVGRGNPSNIQEQDETFYIPLVPKENPSHFAYASNVTNHALNMGPIGVAVNGVVFFNPFDANQMDASSLMDRCCGHPNPFGTYHYHKYPICLNSPWADEGNAHSPLIGWAFDGFPIYGPYEAPNIMAKDETGPLALNPFNIHFDPVRGWHYHVTPGKFPYLIGGYWGVVDSRNVHRGPPRGGGGGFPGGGGGGGFPPGGGDGPPPGGGPPDFGPPPQ